MKETGAIVNDSKIKISDTRLKIIMCPAVILAKRRIVRATGFTIIPISSTTAKIGRTNTGTPASIKYASNSAYSR